MNTTVGDLMVAEPVCATPAETVDHVRGVMRRNRFHALPVVNPEQEPIGMITTTDLLHATSGDAPISTLMTSGKVWAIQQYSGPHIAARMMRNHNIHHLVVTHEGKITGIISSYDLLRLVEDHRFTLKNPPRPPSSHRTGRRSRSET